MFEIERIAQDLREAVAGLDPACLAGRDAARLTEVAADGEKLFGAAKALLAKRAVDTNAWRCRSHAASPEQWLAEATGSSEAAARETFATVTRLTDLPATEEQLRSGELSLQQAAHVTAGAAADPGSERRLLRTAKQSGMRELRAERERVIAAACDEVEARRRAKRERHLRTWTNGFATHGQFSGPTEAVAKLLHALEPLEQARFEAARRSGEHEAREAYRFDARGCDPTHMLERHHTLEFEQSHRTTYAELGNLCPRHHDLVTHRDHTIEDHRDGTWSLRAPPGEAAA